jgi:hypothetical protein
MLTTVPYVTHPEKEPQNVNAHSVNMLTLSKKFVKIVNITVKSVKTPTKTVKSVKETESSLQNVIVHTDTLKPTPLYVQNVHTNVIPVSMSKITVLNVSKTEFMLRFVTVQLVIITLKKLLTVQLVTKNVNLVFLLLTTVSNVLKD